MVLRRDPTARAAAVLGDQLDRGGAAFDGFALQEGVGRRDGLPELVAQIAAGADAVQLFDTHGGLLPDEWFEAGSGRWMRRIISELGGTVPVIVFSKGARDWNTLVTLGADVLGIDPALDLAQARQLVPEDIALQGNLDPVLMNTTPAIARRESTRLLESMRGGAGHIFNLGHGVLPETPVDHVIAMVDAVHELSARYHERHPAAAVSPAPEAGPNLRAGLGSAAETAMKPGSVFLSYASQDAPAVMKLRDALDAAGIPVYHTNVVLSVGERFAVICAESLRGDLTTDDGDWYNAAEVEKSIGNITDALGNLGFAFVDVRPRVDFLSAHLFGRHVVERADDPRDQGLVRRSDAARAPHPHGPRRGRQARHQQRRPPRQRF